MKKSYLRKMYFNYSGSCPLIKLFGGRKERIPLEYINYIDKCSYCDVTRVNRGGTFMVIGIYSIHFYSNPDHNLPFVILFGDII